MLSHLGDHVNSKLSFNCMIFEDEFSNELEKRAMGKAR